MSVMTSVVKRILQKQSEQESHQDEQDKENVERRIADLQSKVKVLELRTKLPKEDGSR